MERPKGNRRQGNRNKALIRSWTSGVQWILISQIGGLLSPFLFPRYLAIKVSAKVTQEF
jgi:hypothetical protein